MTQYLRLQDTPQKCYGAEPASKVVPPPQHWTLETLRSRFADAAETLKRLPLPPGGLPPVTHAAWPDTLQEWLAYGWTAAKTRSPRPSPQAISRLDQVLAWTHWLTPDQRMVIWARAAGNPWKRIEWLDDNVSRRRHGRQQRQLKNILDDAEARCLSRLNGTPPRIVVQRKPPIPKRQDTRQVEPNHPNSQR
jgi:hypothetical protein